MKQLMNKNGYRLLVIVTLALVFVSFRDYFIQFAEDDRAAALFPSFFAAGSMVFLYVVPTAPFAEELAI